MKPEKSEIRKDIIAKRKQLSETEYQKRSDCICRKIMETPSFQKASVVYAYFAVQKEVSLGSVFEECFRQGKVLALPRVEGKEIFFYQVNSMEDLEEGSFHVMEPKERCQKAPKADLILVPGVAFTHAGGRLGYGGGFYDRFFEKNSMDSIGVGFSFQVLRELPLEQHDICLNRILSD